MTQALIGMVMGIFIGNTFLVESLNANICAVILVVSIDAIFGAIKAKFKGCFNDKIVFIGFIINLSAALLLLYLGNCLNVHLHYVVLVVFGIRMFSNLSFIQGYLVNKYKF